MRARACEISACLQLSKLGEKFIFLREKVYYELSLVLVVIIFFVIIALFYLFFRIVTREKQISIQAELVNLFLGVLRPKNFLKKIFMNPPRSKLLLKTSKKFSEKYDTKYYNINGTELLTSMPKKTQNNLHILYFHGGAYILGKNNVKGNESFISNLLNVTDTKVTFVDYPVAPESKFDQTLDKVYEVYTYLSEEYPDDEFVLVGDSAGGGLALSLAQIISEKKMIRRPIKNVLFSPWLDLSLDNPGIDKLAKKDMILSKEALLYAAEQYSNAGEFKNPKVSPIYGNFRGVGSTIIFFSTSELFYADGLKMQQAAERDKLDICFIFFNEMPHDWVIFPIPEAKTALQDAYKFILD